MKKVISLLLALVMALSLVACGAKNDTKTDDTANPDGEATPTNALEQIKADGVLTVARSPDFSPMEFVDSSKTGQDQYVGFDVTLAKYIAESPGGVRRKHRRRVQLPHSGGSRANHPGIEVCGK